MSSTSGDPRHPSPTPLERVVSSIVLDLFYHRGLLYRLRAEMGRLQEEATGDDHVFSSYIRDEAALNAKVTQYRQHLENWRGIRATGAPLETPADPASYLSVTRKYRDLLHNALGRFEQLAASMPPATFEQAATAQPLFFQWVRIKDFFAGPPPQDFREFHDLMRAALELLDQAQEAYNTGFEHGDAVAFSTGKDQMLAAKSTLSKAMALMDSIQPPD
jgi:hypothetical protein